MFKQCVCFRVDGETLTFHWFAESDNEDTGG